MRVAVARRAVMVAKLESAVGAPAAAAVQARRLDGGARDVGAGGDASGEEERDVHAGGGAPLGAVEAGPGGAAPAGRVGGEEVVRNVASNEVKNVVKNVASVQGRERVPLSR